MQHDFCLTKTHLTKEEMDHINRISYPSTKDTIMYAVLCTRPDILYALSASSIYQIDFGETHWVPVKNILRNLRMAKDSFLIYGGQEDLGVISYTNSIFQTEKDGFRSQLDNVFCLNGGIMSH